MNGSAASSSTPSASSGPQSGNTAPSHKQQPKSAAGASAKSLEGSRKQSSSPVNSSNTASSSKKAPAKAWTSGTNPITQRSNTSSPMANGVTNGYPKPEGSNAETRDGLVSNPTGDRHAHDRSLFLLANLTGLDVSVTLRNGEQFSGIFSGVSSQSHDGQYLLKMVRRIRAATSPAEGAAKEPLQQLIGETDEHTMSFSVQDCQLEAPAVDFSVAASRLANGAASSFRTDVEISGNLNLRERELQRWEPSMGDNTDMSLGGDTATAPGAWDQFAANKKLFNTQSDYNEDLYTTAINRNDPKYLENMQKADVLAREIERGSEARRGAEADSGLDEEDKYSGVRRDTPSLAKRGPNAYVPPSQRLATNERPSSGNAIDPAIISSQLARAPPTATAEEPTTSAEITNALNGIPSKDTKPVPDMDKSSSTKLPAAITDPINAESAVATPQIKAPEAAPSDQQKDNPFTKTLDAFKLFSSQEKIRSHEHARAMQARKTNNARQEKSVKLNDLKKFSQNFKLHSRVPEDLVPILAKSKDKQDEIRDKADQQAREKEKKDKEVVSSPPAKLHSTHAPPSGAQEGAAEPSSGNRARQTQPSKQQGPSGQPYARGPGMFNQRVAQNNAQFRASANVPPPLPIQSMQNAPAGAVESGPMSPTSAATRLNVKAMEFRPNPAASTFTPTAPSAAEPPRSKRPSVAGSAMSSTPVVSTGNFFSSSKKPSKMAESSVADVISNSLNTIKRMLDEPKDDQKKGMYSSNGGIPQPYRTPPVWDTPEANQDKSYNDFFPKASAQPPMSPVHGQPNGAMPHQHQLPPHLQNSGGQHGPRYFPGQQGPHMPPHMDDGRNPSYSSNSSVQPSPRMGHPSLAYPGQMQPQMPGYAYGVPAASGMSPAMHMRAVPGGQYMSPQGPMGGQMMVQQPSNGPYMNSPGPPQQMPMYSSPGPSHPQPHYGGQHGMPGGYQGSPRGHPMSHQGSQQGHSQGMYMMPQQGGPMMMPQHGGPMTPMRGYAQPHYGGGPHPQGYAMQHRAMSGSGYGQMTPRQHHAMPQGPNMGGPMMPSHSSQGGDDGR